MPSRSAIVTAARAFLGTPYHHQGALRGAGCDCLGLIRGVWRDLYGAEPETPPPYTPDWGEVDGAETLLGAAQRHMTPVALTAAAAGDVLLFRLRPAAVAKHVAILTGPDHMIHALSGDQVREVAITSAWRGRVTAAFAFPSKP